MDIYSGLNPEQLEAVTTTRGPLLIFAGAGSGKTRVITHRIAHLILKEGVAPQSIFAVTFTNKAAQEMRERIERLIGPTGNNVFIRTFHSASVAILRQYGNALGLDRSFTIYDRADQETVLKGIIKDEYSLDPKKIRPASLASEISAIKDREEYVSGADVTTLFPSIAGIDFADLFARYHEILRGNNALDFNDLIIKTVTLLRESPDTLADLQRRWRYFMIDEYQDTNHAQYLMAKYLSAASGNLCVVGDDDQSIYSWRGADIRNILNFESDFSGTKTVTLNRNYRSAKPILAAASAVIGNNVNRKEKNLLAVIEDGEPVTIVEAANEYAEAEFAVNTIQTLKSQERLTNRDFAIFYRTNAQSRVFEDMLRRNNISYRVVGGLKFYDRKEIKDIVAYLKFIANPADSVAFIRIINTLARGIGDATIDRIREEAARYSRSMWEIVRDDMLTGRVPKTLPDFARLMNDFFIMAGSVPGETALPALVTAVCDRSGYRKSLEEEPGIESRTRLENIDEFINSIYDYSAQNPEAGLDQFLQEISLMTTEENPEGEGEAREEGITLMTVHNAKGLEFTVVFLTGLEEETFPHRFSLETEGGIEEERRLCYVGMTRARERLFLSSSELRRSYNNVFSLQPSRFLEEIPPAFTVRKRAYSQSFQGAENRSSKVFEKEAPKPVVPPRAEPRENGSAFFMGEKLLHPKYGMGKVTKIEGTGDNVKLTLSFSSGKKTFLEKYTPLSRIG